MVLTMKSSKRLLITFLILCGFALHADLALSRGNKAIRNGEVRMLEGDWEMTGYYSRTFDVNKVAIQPIYWGGDSDFAPGSRIRFVFSENQKLSYTKSIAAYEVTGLTYTDLLCEHEYYKYLCVGRQSEQYYRRIEIFFQAINPKDWKTDFYDYAPTTIKPRFEYFLQGAMLKYVIDRAIIFESKDQFYMEEEFDENSKAASDPDNPKSKIAGTVGLIFKRVQP
jgi:hypothetical protein